MPGCDDTPGNGYDSFVQDMNDPGSHNLQGNSIPDLGGNGFTGSAIGGNLGNPLEYGHDNVDERWTLISKLEALRHRGRYPQRSRTGEEDVSRDLNSKFPTDATQMTVYNRCPVQQAGMQTSHTQNDDIRKNDFFDDPYNRNPPAAFEHSDITHSTVYAENLNESPRSYLSLPEEPQYSTGYPAGVPDLILDQPMQLASGNSYQNQNFRIEFPASSVSPRGDVDLHKEAEHLPLPFDQYYLNELEEDVSHAENLSEHDEVLGDDNLAPANNLLAVVNGGRGHLVQNRLKKEMRWLISNGSKRGSGSNQIQSQPDKESMKKTFLSMRRNQLSITHQGFADTEEVNDTVQSIEENAQLALDHREIESRRMEKEGQKQADEISAEPLDEVQRFKLGEMLKEMQRNFDDLFQRRSSNRTLIERSIYDIIMYNSMMHAQAGAARAGHACADDGFAVLNRMMEAGITPTYMTFYKLLELIEGASYHGSSNMTHVERVLERMKQEGIGKDAGIYRLQLGVIAGLASMGRSSVAQAYMVVQNMRNDGICEGEDELKMIMKIAVSSSRYGQSSSKDAHRIIDRMRALYLSPDLETFILAMQVHVYSAAWGFATVPDAEKLIEQAQELGISHHPALYKGFFQVASASAAHNQASLKECEKVLDKMSKNCRSPPSTRLFGDAFQIYALEAKNGRASVEDGIRLLKRLEDAHGKNVLSRCSPRRSRSKGRVLRSQDDELSAPARSRSSEQVTSSDDRQPGSRREPLPQCLTPNKDIAKSSRKVCAERRALERGFIAAAR